MTINTIIAHNWAILYSGDSTTKISDIEGKTRSQAQPAKKLSGLETAKRKKKRRVVLPQKNLDFLTSQKTQLKGSALIENGRRSKSWFYFEFWFVVVDVYNWGSSQFSVEQEMHYYQCNVNFWFNWREVKTHFETHGNQRFSRPQ